MKYLQVTEHSAENLQFYLWIVDYTKRFNDAGHDVTRLSRQWGREHVSEAASAFRLKVASAGNSTITGSGEGHGYGVLTVVAPWEEVGGRRISTHASFKSTAIDTFAKAGIPRPGMYYSAIVLTLAKLISIKRLS